MDKKVIIAIAAVAIIVVAGVCIYFAFMKDDKKLGGTEVYSDIKVGDVIDLKVDVAMTSDTTAVVDVSEALENMYFAVVGAQPVGTKDVAFDGKTYSCDIYEISNEETDDTITYYVIRTSGVILEMEQENGYQKLKSTNCDLEKTIEEQQVVVGTTFTYHMLAAIPGASAKMASGELTCTVTELGSEDDCKLRTVMDLKQNSRESRQLESITGDVYKFKDDDTEYTKDGAMSIYAYPSLENYLKDQFGDSVVMGAKTTQKIDTAYGEREVTVQSISVNVFGFSTDYKCYYGSKDVMYKVEGSALFEGFGLITTTSELLDCDAVKSL